MARGKGVYKRGGVWWIRYAGPDGRIRFESCRSSNYKEAEVILIQKRKEVQEGKDPIAQRRLATTCSRNLPSTTALGRSASGASEQRVVSSNNSWRLMRTTPCGASPHDL